MSIYASPKNNDGIARPLTPLDEKRKAASIALKRVDQLIKIKEYQQALLEIAHVKEMDKSNVYVFALEERIKGLQAENIHLEQQHASQAASSPDASFGQDSLHTVAHSIHEPRQSNLPELITPDDRSTKPIEWRPKVVIIDDDVNLLNVLGATVESEGFEVFSLSTSDEAYMLLRKIIPDLILCDINLETSTMGGFAFYEKVRELKNMKRVPFIFLSGLTDDVLIRTGKEMGVDDYLTKPIKGQNLIAAIRGRIKRYRELGLSSSPTIQGSMTSIAFNRISS